MCAPRHEQLDREKEQNFCHSPTKKNFFIDGLRNFLQLIKLHAQLFSAHKKSEQERIVQHLRHTNLHSLFCVYRRKGRKKDEINARQEEEIQTQKQRNVFFFGAKCHTD